MPTPANARDRSHARIYSHWRELPAWHYMSPAAKALLLEIMMDYRPRPGNNGYLPWTVRRAASAVNVGKATAATALEELEACGWITCEHIGGFGRRNAGSEFALTMFLSNRTGQLATYAVERWEPAPGVIRARRTRVRPGGQDCPVRGTQGPNHAGRCTCQKPCVRRGLATTLRELTAPLLIDRNNSV